MPQDTRHFSAIYGIDLTNGISTVAEYTAMTGIVTAGTYTTSAAYVTLLQKNSDLVDAVTAGGAATKASFLASQVSMSTQPLHRLTLQH